MPAAWPSLTLLNLRRSFEIEVALLERPVRDSPGEVNAALARLLVIRSCGYLERVSEESCKCYIATKSIPQIYSFATSWLEHGANPTPANLVALARRFDPTWGDELQALFDDDDEVLSREIAFLVDRRNKIAHGWSENTGAAKALTLARHAATVADWFIQRLDPR